MFGHTASGGQGSVGTGVGPSLAAEDTRSGIGDWLRLEWDRVGAWLLILVGLVLLIVGYFEVSGTVYPAEQIPYLITGGIGGLFALGLGCMFWLSADLRDEWRKLDRIEAAIKSGARSDLTGAPEGSSTTTPKLVDSRSPVASAQFE